MGAKTGGKSARIVKQNGKGKAQEKGEPSENGPDFSILRKPIEIGVPGLNQVVKVYQNGTPELQHLLSYECDVVYECKVCRNLFRSLANFISHKRVYCTELFSNAPRNLYKINKQVDDTAVIVQPETMRVTRSRDNCGSGNNEKTEGKGESKTKNGRSESAPFRITIKKDLTSIVERLMQKNAANALSEPVEQTSSASEFYDGVSKELAKRRKEAREHTVHLEPIDNTSCGVFQTIVRSSSASELIKSQVKDLERIMADTEAILGPDGRVIENGISHMVYPANEKLRKTKETEDMNYKGPPVTAPEDEVELYCNLCKKDFTSYKSLNNHMRSLHMTLRTFYPCPYCKLPLSNSWNVYRHLLKVHRKTNEQIRKLREKVMKRSCRKEVLQSGAQKLKKPYATENPMCPTEPIYDNTYNQVVNNEEENEKQWYDIMDDSIDMQCCVNCGRRFERRAALFAHSQSCLKRIPAKQNVVPSSKQSNQPDKRVALGRLPSMQGKLSFTGPSPTTPNALKSLLARPLQLSPMENDAPTTKIEIQVRRDYGKSPSIAESRTRTSSISRSEDGAASLSKSEDGMTSASSETEFCGSFDQQQLVSNEVDQISVEESSNAASSQKFSNEKLTKDTVQLIKEKPTKRGVGRPPKPRPDVVQANGLNSKEQATGITQDRKVSVTAADKEMNLPLLLPKDESRKRKASESQDVDSENENDSSSNDDSSDHQITKRYNDHEKRMAALSNVKKLQCLTCRKKYKTLGNLRRHVAIHIGWNRFRCIICDFKCFSKCDCVSHALSVHLEPWEKAKAAAMVQDIQMDAGGSTDILSCDSADSEHTFSESNSPDSTADKSSISVSPDVVPIDLGEDSIENSNGSETNSVSISSENFNICGINKLENSACNIKCETVSIVPK